MQPSFLSTQSRNLHNDSMWKTKLKVIPPYKIVVVRTYILSFFNTHWTPPTLKIFYFIFYLHMKDDFISCISCSFKVLWFSVYRPSYAPCFLTYSNSLAFSLFLFLLRNSLHFFVWFPFASFILVIFSLSSLIPSPSLFHIINTKISLNCAL